jgi:hypothetical protein
MWQGIHIAYHTIGISQGLTTRSSEIKLIGVIIDCLCTSHVEPLQ